jgi:hypothetical protein
VPWPTKDTIDPCSCLVDEASEPALMVVGERRLRSLFNPKPCLCRVPRNTHSKGWDPISLSSECAEHHYTLFHRVYYENTRQSFCRAF